MLISVDTDHLYVAQMAMETGVVDLLNDTSGTGALAGLASRDKVPIIFMHKKGTSKEMMSLTLSYPHADQLDPEKPGSFIQDIEDELRTGPLSTMTTVSAWNILVDPGIGFAKSTRQDLALLKSARHSRLMRQYPMVIGASRKKFIKACNAESINGDRAMATCAACTAAIAQGAAIVRIHDLELLLPACRLADAIYKT
jgi:dihydropteroate synthase